MIRCGEARSAIGLMLRVFYCMAWVLALSFGTEIIDAGPAEDAAAFERLSARARRPVLSDPCTGDWREHWVLDGEKATVETAADGMSFRAGPVERDDSCHAVLWTHGSVFALRALP